MLPKLFLLGLLCCWSLFAQLEPAVEKKDAKYYLFGSALFGVSTKPIYILDVKVETEHEFRQNQFVGVRASLTSNAGAEPPNDRSEIDPDSIMGALTYQTSWAKVVGGYDVFLSLDPVRGEFTRKHPSSNLVTAGFATFARKRPYGLAKGDFLVYPSVGYELGRNLNTPSVLFKRPVNLEGYDRIVRLVPGGRAVYYRLVETPKKEQIYRFVFDASYQARLLLADEPFVRAEFVLNDAGIGTRQKVTRLRRNARHITEIGATWGLTPLLGLRVQYRFGSLPPLFEFVNHQVTIGMTFKAK
jgi:hypothetical protein